MHLFAYNVIHGKDHVPVLPMFADAGRLDLDSGSLPAEIYAFIDGPGAHRKDRIEHRLIRRYGESLGQAWAALAVFNNTDGRAGEKRKPVPIPRPNFADSSTIKDDSSPSKQRGESPSPFKSPKSAGDRVDRDAHSKDNSPPETRTLHLVSCAFRHILYYCPPQAGNNPICVVEFRDVRNRYKALLRKDMEFVAEGDGGLSVNFGDGLRISRESPVIIEAKKRFECIEDGIPIISDACFAQMAEALAKRPSQDR